MIWDMETVGNVSRLYADANIATPYARGASTTASSSTDSPNEIQKP